MINMKISISKIESEEGLRDLSTETGGKIIGGGTSGSASADVSAFGDVTQTKTDGGSYTYTLENDYGKYSFTTVFAYGTAYSAEYKK